MSGSAELAAALERLVCARIPGATGIERLRRLSGGASQETWSFDATTGGDPLALILRRRPGPAGALAAGALLALLPWLHFKYFALMVAVGAVGIVQLWRAPEREATAGTEEATV